MMVRRIHTGFIKIYFSDKIRINRVLLHNHKEITATLREMYSEQQEGE